MKLVAKVLVVAAFAPSLALFSCGSEKKKTETAPEKVQTAFTQKFPHATNVKWEKENETEWEAEFKMDGMEYSANYTQEGEWKETEHEVGVADIPTVIKSHVDSAYAGYKIEEAELSETVKGTQYEIKVEKGEETLAVFYTSDGIFMNQEKETGEEEDKK